MTVDIRGTNSFNYGAQLMLRASVEALSGEFSLSAPPQLSKYSVRSRLGLRQTLVWNQVPRLSLQLGNLVPRTFTSAFGLVSHSHVTGVVDASGFAYSDSFTRRRIRREAIFAAAWKKRGVPVVLLPQAFGPFTDKEKREWTRRLIGSSALVFARDRVSLEHLQGLEVDARIELRPDFTIPLKAPVIPPVSTEPFVAIVPNFKLVTSGVAREADYVKTLSGYADAAEAAGLKPLLLIHDANDKGIIDAVQSARRVPLDVFESADPLVLKAALAQAQYVVSSRFHAIVSALAGTVPTLALGWSHKYKELLHDFDSEDWITGVDSDPRDGFALLTAQPREDVQTRLIAAKARLIDQIDDMWALTRATLSNGV